MPKYSLSAEQVRGIRRTLGETQAQFAEHLDVDAVTVARWETGQRQCVGLYAKTITQLADNKNQMNNTFLLFKNDIRKKDPNNTGHRKAEFRKGWKKAIEGEIYNKDILENLTWNNLGYRLGKLFGETSPEQIDEIYDWCVHHQQAQS
ncbi:hypothetical protein [Coleofasciculus sp. FACHB-T130]|uniref:helix-turn-helix domain-containing protein n=1 Tax=Cyanophyceae TaxID=3028117 RepID=UPI0018EF4190|nr:hypothetical protein [Coleofasciculus sp. FACHB-T130]